MSEDEMTVCTKSRTDWRGVHEALWTLLSTTLVLPPLIALALTGCDRWRNTGDTEALQMVYSVRLGEEAHFAEYGRYASANRGFQDLCPAAPTRGRRAKWNPSCGSGVDGPWSGVLHSATPPDTVGFGISAVAETTKEPGSITVAGHTFPEGPLPPHWYAVFARTTEGNEFLTTSFGKRSTAPLQGGDLPVPSRGRRRGCGRLKRTRWTGKTRTTLL